MNEMCMQGNTLPVPRSTVSDYYPQLLCDLLYGGMSDFVDDVVM